MGLKISVVIPTHDRPAELARLVKCLCSQSLRPDEIIVVNDGTGAVEPDLIERARSRGIEVQLIRRFEPCASASRNAGLGAATGDMVVCLDDDMVPDEEFLTGLYHLYQCDKRREVAGIGVQYEEQDRGWKGRLWEIFSCAAGRMRWRPRVRASDRVRLGAYLSGLLEPAIMMPGGAMSLRGSVARAARFDETMGSRSFGEDREFSYRVGRSQALFVTRKMRIAHRPGEGGRGSWLERGRIYVRNVLHIADRSLEKGAGTTWLVAVDLAGAFVQHLLWGLAGPGRHNLQFAAGMVREFSDLLRNRAGRILCGY